MGKSKKIADLQMPRRASKRLAGIPLDPAPETETPNRARKGLVKKSSDTVKKAVEDSSSDKLGTHLEAKSAITLEGTKRPLDSKRRKPPTPSVSDPSEDTSNEETVKESHEKPSTVTSPPCTESVAEGNKKIKTDNNNDKRTGLPLDLPLGGLWKDPCIAFAIKTLTGVPVDNSEGMKELSGSSNNTFEESAGLEEHAMREAAGNGEGEKQRHGVVFPLGNISIPKEHMGDAETSDKYDGKSGSITDWPFSEVLADPCIEFAVKTLTGAIPLDYSMVVQDFLPKQVLSFQQQENRGFALQNVAEFRQNELSYQQFGTMQRPSLNQAAMMQPAFSHTRNPGMRYSAGPGRGYGHMGDRSNKFQR